MPCIQLVKCLRLNDLSGPGRIRSACKHTVASVSLPVPPDRPDARRSADLAAGSPVSQAFLILPENEIPLYVYGGQRRAKFGITHSLHEHGEGGLSLYRIGLASGCLVATRPFGRYMPGSATPPAEPNACQSP